MHLKHLELQGFKSFANRTAFEFPKGFTAIVGPNGAGKSNIVDAIRWAMGEQSMKRIRSSEGEDLIFSGSEGAARKGRAAVRMVLDNADQSVPVESAEVEIERSIGRDGVSDFRINRESVRMADVVELLAHANVGHRSTAVINQGMEAEILRAGPAELRDMLEESSGIKPLQIKRAKAERRLRAAERHRKEAQVLLRELRPHLKFLESQAGRLTEKRSLEEELSRAASALSAHEASVVRGEVDRIHRETKELDAAILTGEKAVTVLERDVHGSSRPDEGPLRAIRTERRSLEEKRRELERRQAVREAMRGARSLEHAASGADNGRNVETALKETIRRLQAIVDAASSAWRDEVTAVIAFIRESFADRAAMEASVTVPRQDPDGGTTAALAEIIRRLEVLEASEAAALREWQEALVGRTKELRDVEGKLREARERRREASWRRGQLEELSARIQEAVRGIAVASTAGVTEQPHRSLGGEPEVRSALERIGGLRQKIEALSEGDASLLSEYEEVRSRVTTLEEQIADCSSAMRSLMNAVRELDRRMKRQFTQNLNIINQRFHHFFRMLFGGGKADLRVVESAAPADGEKGAEVEEQGEDAVDGLVVVAQLPGKRVSDLHSFSGGEKALTAIALLLAIVSANPPPFLVLDEVDAALDESNAQRFCAILRELGAKTQFLLITHNRETMRSADLLYGVTMGGDGVSQILSLKLERARELAAMDTES